MVDLKKINPEVLRQLKEVRQRVWPNAARLLAEVIPGLVSEIDPMFGCRADIKPAGQLGGL